MKGFRSARRWRFWLRAREMARVTRPCRVPALLVLAGVAFLAAGQGEDVARTLAEQRSGNRNAWTAVWFFAASLAWSLSAWYWARVMLMLKLPGIPPERPRFARLRTWLPRLLGFLATLGVAVAFLKAAQGYSPDENPEVRDLLQFYSAWCFAGAFAFLAAVTLRRWIFRLPPAHRQRYGVYRVRQLSRATLAVLAFSVLASWVLFALIVFAPQRVAPALGSAAIVLLAAANWTAVASVADFVGMRTRFPVFATALLLAVVFSFWNDNHEVRTLAARQPVEKPSLRPGLRDSLHEWMSHHKARLAKGRERVPLYVVNAEGGGIRAAYWTASVLGEIQDRQPCFADHLFSISGVSGGSLGASVFVALVARDRELAPAPGCERKVDFRKTGQLILGEDFLSPVVAGMLYPDLAQRFWPWPVEGFDRARLLERSWERAWGRHVEGRNRLREPLDRLYEDRSRWMPALFLNATWVETGKRIITSNVRVSAASRDEEDFIDSEDAQAFFHPRSLPLSTAAHMSARFTYVSPAGTLVRRGRTHGRVVDGGYFENSGATTTLEILEGVFALAEEEPALWKRVDVYVIHISNEPADPAFAADTLAAAPDHPLIAPKDFLNEALSPLRALLSTRGARGFHARETAMWRAGTDSYFHFGLCRRSANIPLGWVLSASTRRRMDAQLSVEQCVAAGAPVFDNPAALQAIEARLGAPRPPQKI